METFKIDNFGSKENKTWTFIWIFGLLCTIIVVILSAPPMLTEKEISNVIC